MVTATSERFLEVYNSTMKQVDQRKGPSLIYQFNCGIISSIYMIVFTS